LSVPRHPLQRWGEFLCFGRLIRRRKTLSAEAIKRAHTEYIAATIPGAGLLILPNTSHFAFLQDPTLFNAALLHFLGDR